jgi:hypothetical protein
MLARRRFAAQWLAGLIMDHRRRLFHSNLPDALAAVRPNALAKTHLALSPGAMQRAATPCFAFGVSRPPNRQ